MNEKPINMTGDSVRKILAGEKTQTRRVMKIQPPTKERFRGSAFGLYRCVADHIKIYSQNDYNRLEKHPTDWELLGSVGVARDAGLPMRYRCPYVVGQHLWIREDYASIPAMDRSKPSDIPCGVTIYYDADGSMTKHYISDGTEVVNTSGRGINRPGLFMPRKFSRILLEIVSIKVERVQDISEADCIAEGCPKEYLLGQNWYKGIWDEINGKKPGRDWDSNCWVWAIKFRKVDN